MSIDRIDQRVVADALANTTAIGLRSARDLRVACADGMPLSIHLLEFDAGEFSANAFQAAAIACPPGIARSVRKRQAEFFFGRLAARSALAAAASPHTVTIGIGNSREPIWPAGIVGSISHTRSLAAAAAEHQGRRQGIGLDIECTADPEALAVLLNAIVDAREVRYLRSQAGALSLATLATLAFSAKESFFKGAFPVVGRFFEYGVARLVSLDPALGRLELMLTETLSKHFPQGHSYELGFELIEANVVLTHFVW